MKPRDLWGPVFFMVCMLGTLLLCDSLVYWLMEKEEIKRVLSPDHKKEAVLVKIQGEYFLKEEYLLFIVASGNAIERGAEAFRASQIKDLKVSWVSNRQVIVKFDKARISYFRDSDYVWLDKPDGKDWPLKIRLHLSPNNPRKTLPAEP